MRKQGISYPEGSKMFLHENWRNSTDFREHQKQTRAAAARGENRPPIPDHIRAKYTVSWDDLCTPIAETELKLVPREDQQGNVLRNNRGEVQFRKEKPVINRGGVVDGIKGLFRPD